MIFFLEVFVQLRRLSTAFKNCLLFNFVVALVDFSFPRQSLSFWRSWELSKSKAIHGDQDWYVCDRKIVDKTYNSLWNFEVRPKVFQKCENRLLSRKEWNSVHNYFPYEYSTYLYSMFPFDTDTITRFTVWKCKSFYLLYFESQTLRNSISDAVRKKLLLYASPPYVCLWQGPFHSWVVFYLHNQSYFDSVWFSRLAI